MQHHGNHRVEELLAAMSSTSKGGLHQAMDLQREALASCSFSGLKQRACQPQPSHG